MTAAALLGIVGGVAIAAAFIPGISWSQEAFQLRLVLFNVGAIAILAAVRPRRANTPFSRTVAAAAIAANAWYLAMVVLSIGRPQFPEPDSGFRFIAFGAGAAMWLTDAAFGLVALRNAVLARPAAIALAIGSVLAFLGMDRLGLVQSEVARLVQPLALIGIGMNGLAWILVGIDLLRSRTSGARRGIAN
jgi:hypothetical protein